MHELEVTNPYKIGLPCGLGEIKFADGSVYKGQVRNGRPNGTGEYISASGEKKLGTFKNGVLVGVGTERTHDGISRKGEWRCVGGAATCGPCFGAYSSSCASFMQSRELVQQICPSYRIWRCG